MTLVDVGANEGLFTLVAALRVGDSGRILALEPSSREFEHLRKNIDLNGLKNVEPLRLALYNHSGHGKLACAEFGHEGLNAIGERIANTGVAVTGSETVELETLDALVAARGVDRLDFIKIDAEGSEARILEGALGTINRFQPVILLEIEPENLAAQGSTTDGLLELVAGVGYRIWVFDSQGQPRPRSPDSPLGTNVIAAPLEWQPPNIP
jgi:FkbM family methyltransferase